MRLIIVLILLSSSYCIAEAQNVNRTWGWSKHAHGAGVKENLQVRVDVYGNVYSLIRFYGLFVYGSYSYNSPMGNTALIKHDRYGNVIYIKIYPLEMRALAVDNDENVYLAGGDLMIRLGWNGGEYWRRNLGSGFGGVTGRIEDMVVDNDQNIIVAAIFTGDNFTWAGIPISANTNNIHVIVSKINPSGLGIWATCAKNGTDDYFPKVAVDAHNSVYVVGEANAGISYDGTNYAPNCNECLYLAKFDSAGKHLWIKNVMSSTGFTIEDDRGIVVDDSSYVYVGGHPGGYSIVARYDTSGQQRWIAKNLQLDLLLGLAVDNNSNSYITGSYYNWGVNKWEQQVLQIKPDGKGGTLWRLNPYSIGGYIACDKSNNLYVVGNFNDSVQLGDTTYLAKNAPGGDLFLAQLEAQKLVTLNSYDKKSYCITDTITAYFSNVDTAFKTGNSFVFELSSATGSFKQPTLLGTYTTTAAADSFKFVPPSSVTAGNKYLIRIRSTNPVYYTMADSVIALDTLPSQPVITLSGQQLSTKKVTGILQWYRNGNAITGATDTIYVPASSGDYTVTHTTKNGCVVSSNVTVFWAANIGETSKYDIRVFPNPITDNVIVQHLPDESSIKITDITGKTLYRTNGVTGRISIPTDTLTPGIYFLIIKLNNGTELQYKLSK